jgi:hypothetical protein
MKNWLRERWQSLTGIAVGALLVGLVLAGRFACASYVGPASWKPITAEHPAVEQMLAALRDGSIFDPAIYVRASAAPQSQERAAGLLRETQADFREVFGADVPQFALAAGCEFRLRTRSGERVEVSVPMPGEAAEHPSRFSLLTRWPHQVYIEFSVVDAGGVERRLHVFAPRVGGRWRPVGLWFSRGARRGVTAERALTAAREQERSGSLLAALALYALAGDIAAGCPFRISAMQEQVAAGAERCVETVRSRGAPPAVRTEGGEFPVQDVGVLEMPAGSYVQLLMPVRALGEPADMGRLHARIARALLRERPVLKDYFAGVALSMVATEPGGEGKGYRSVHRFSELEGEPAHADG